VVPAGAEGNSGDRPRIVLTTQKLLLSGSDVFYAIHSMHSAGDPSRWSEPLQQQHFARRKTADGREMTVCDFWPAWHAKSRRLLGIGHTVWYKNNAVMRVRPRATAYAVYDAKKNAWGAWSELEMPREARFANAGAGCVQRYDLPDGDVLLPIYFKKPKDANHSVTVVRCTFDGTRLQYVRHGNEMTVADKRGLGEPSLAKFGDRYYLTMRNDKSGYVTSSADGLHFDTPRRWTFDDATELGSYNTQQHWVAHSGGLHLVYTRRGADNDHVFRHRAPLFIARVDTEKLCVIRSTERVLVPNYGARLGNFGVTDVSPQETWVVVTEWMQPEGVQRHGSDNRIWIAVVRWNEPNRLVRDQPGCLPGEAKSN
jgi:hypothetical protein